MIHVTRYAIERYQEQVRNLTDSEVITALSGPTFVKAADFGAPYVKLGTGQHAVICDRRVVTILPKDTWLATMSAASIANLKHARS